MTEKMYHIILMGAGSGGLSVGSIMNKPGFKVLMIAKTDNGIGGQCLSDGCLSGKALRHISGIAKKTKTASGVQIEYKRPDIKMRSYIR